MVMCMLVLLILDGLLDTHMLSMVPLATVLLLYCLRVFLLTPTLVSIGCVGNSIVQLFDRTLLGDGPTFKNQTVLYSTYCY